MEMHTILNLTVSIYTCVRYENCTIARNLANFTIKSNIWDQIVNRAIVKLHCLNPRYSRTPCIDTPKGDGTSVFIQDILNNLNKLI